MMLTSTFSR